MGFGNLGAARLTRVCKRDKMGGFEIGGDQLGQSYIEWKVSSEPLDQ